MNYMCGTILFAALSVVPVRAATGIRGSLHDESGAVIGNATVIVISEQGQLLKTSTDAAGKYSIEVADGIQDVLATGVGFAPACLKILVRHDRWADFSRVLKVDPLTVKLRGDTFDMKSKK